MEALTVNLGSLRRETIINMFLVIFFSVGVAGLSMDFSRELFVGLMPFSLLLGMGLMFWVQPSWSSKHVLVFAVIALWGFGVEVAGVLTGEVFGSYSYGGALGFQLWGTPPLIGLNWLMLVYAVFVIMNRFRLAVILKILLGALLMVVYDVIMEPVAIRLDMWSWGGDEIPLQNYIAWYVISAVMLGILYLTQLNIKNKVAPVLFFVQMGFFLALNIFLIW